MTDTKAKHTKHFQCPGCGVQKPTKELGEVSSYIRSNVSGVFGTNSQKQYQVECLKCNLTYILDILYGSYMDIPNPEEPEEEPEQNPERFDQVTKEL